MDLVNGGFGEAYSLRSGGSAELGSVLTNPVSLALVSGSEVAGVLVEGSEVVGLFWDSGAGGGGEGCSTSVVGAVWGVPVGASAIVVSTLGVSISSADVVSTPGASIPPFMCSL